jgi:hypothetical protein
VQETKNWISLGNLDKNTGEGQTPMLQIGSPTGGPTLGEKRKDWGSHKGATAAGEEADYGPFGS